MVYSNYRLHRQNWLIWRWVAEYHGLETRTGFAFSERCARWAARCWLRSRLTRIADVSADFPVVTSQAEPAPDAGRAREKQDSFEKESIPG